MKQALRWSRKASRRMTQVSETDLLKRVTVDPHIYGPANSTRAQLIAELEALRAAGAFERVTSLRNQYSAPSLKSVSDKQLLAAIHDV